MKSLGAFLLVCLLIVFGIVMFWPVDGAVTQEIELLRVSGQATRVALDNERRDIDNAEAKINVQVAQDVAPVRAASINSMITLMTSALVASPFIAIVVIVILVLNRRRIF